MDKVNDLKKYERVFKMPFKTIYEAYITKVNKKNYSSLEVNQIIKWFTSYNEIELEDYINNKTYLEFLEGIKTLPKNYQIITGQICGIKLSELYEPLIIRCRYLDKLIDELYKGKSLEKLIR